ncbi:MAG: hypothetical protein JXQ75_19740, partial [Phycisphaerae bacterium]|nr:hypothetical protein [Phycisphaerae bacterium]
RQSRNSRKLPSFKNLRSASLGGTERGGFDLPRFCKLSKELWLQFNRNESKDLEVLVDVLFSHGFLMSRTAF